jgi:preprotein translocase subunit SecA
MFNAFIKRVFGTKHERQMKRMQPLIDRINALEPKMKGLADADFPGLTADFRAQLAKGRPLDELTAEAFAAVREASVRALGMRHYDVQMIGAIALHQGRIAEMRTGEGKTLTATSALYLNALVGRGTHLITVNDYLARRDAEWMGQIYRFLGMSVGVIVGGMYHTERQKNYRADITYGTNNEFGFDYLRDNMKETIEKYVQRDLYYAIVDEVDSILIDEARTPLIISGEANDSPDTYVTVNRVIPSLRRDLDFVVDEKAHSVQLTDAGVDRIEKLLSCKNLYAPENNELLHHVNQALRAHVLYKKDVNYIVENGEVIIIDEFRGRKMEGRRWSDGLHQAVEAKEGVDIQPESRTLATITYQNYFRMYDKLAGMTGTADTEAEEFNKIYNLDVVVIPPNRKMVRNDQDDLVYKNERGKFRAVVEEIKQAHERGQPVLVGTASVEKSQVIHNMLDKLGIPHEVLNAKQHEREAYIIAQAGRKGAITVATNMAGRGTDILLGGNAEMVARTQIDPDKDAVRFEALHQALKTEFEKEKGEVKGLGGLYIVGTERHESRRIDNQLRGRAGRQGDPGRSRFFLSLEDDLMRIFGADRITSLMERLGMEEDVPIEAPLVNRAIANAQARVEAMHFDTRKNLFEYDNVMNEQRKAIYALRKQILEGRYQPEILDDAARKEQSKKLLPPPEKSGPHTVESLARTVTPKITTIVEGHIRAVLEEAGLPSDGPIPADSLPPGGIRPEKLSHELYRHYGALVNLEDVKDDRRKIVARAVDVVARSLIQQRERVHDLSFRLVEEQILKLCPETVHPDEWDLDGLEKVVLERFKVKLDLAQVEPNLDKLVDRIWKQVEAQLTQREQEFGLYTYLFYVRKFYLEEIDEQWIAHLKNIEHLRTGIGLVGYATRNPKNEYKIRGYNLFKEMWESIESTVLRQVQSLRLTEEQRQQAEQGAEYETAVTRANRSAQEPRRKAGQGRAAAGNEQVSRLQDAAREAMQRLLAAGVQAPGAQPGQAPQAQAPAQSEAEAEPRERKLPKVGKNDPCPCGSGKLYRRCHGKEAAA